jgi:hypothetical protein
MFYDSLLRVKIEQTKKKHSWLIIYLHDKASLHGSGVSETLQVENYAADVPIFHKLETIEFFLSHVCTEACPGFAERTNTGCL